MALRHQLITVLILVVFIVFVVGLVGPAWVILVQERTLAERLQVENRNGSFTGLTDRDLRLKMQKIGREEGFHLSSDDVIHWASVPLTTDGLSEDGHLGYTLGLQLPVFQLFHFELVAVRSVKIAGSGPAPK